MLSMIAAKAMALKLAESEEFKNIMKKIVENSRYLAEKLSEMGYDIISGGSDTHIVLINLQNKRITGDVAEKVLEQCGIIVNKNSVPNTKATSSRRPMGIRIGTNSLSQRGFGIKEIRLCAELINEVLNHIIYEEGVAKAEPNIQKYVKNSVKDLCYKFPVNGYY